LKRVLLYAAIGGVVIALLRVIEYQHFVRAYPAELYGGLVALIFTAAGVYLGLKWTRPKEVVVVKEVRVRDGEPFVLNAGKLKELGITQREHERHTPSRRCARGARRRPASRRRRSRWPTSRGSTPTRSSTPG
jgi:hypothetical protein